MKKKWCNKCENVFEIDNFRKSTRNKDGFEGLCIKCRRKRDRQRRKQKKCNLLSDINYRLNHHKGCMRCGVLKTLDEFYIREDKIYDVCKECIGKSRRKRKVEERQTNVFINLMKVQNIIKNKFKKGYNDGNK